MMRKSLSFLIILLFIFLFPREGYARADKDLYYRALEAQRLSEPHFAFMYFRALLRDFPESELFEGALFATGEYYYLVGDYYDAEKTFRQFINDYPESSARPFALAYLFKIAKKRGREDLAEDLKKQMLKLKQLIFLFKDLEEYEYISAFSKKYKIVYFIDRVEVYVDDALLTKVPF